MNAFRFPDFENYQGKEVLPLAEAINQCRITRLFVGLLYGSVFRSVYKAKVIKPETGYVGILYFYISKIN